MRRLLALGAFLTFAPGAAALAQQAGAAPSAAQPVDARPAVKEAAPELPPGQKIFNQCQARHTFDKGARTLIGPNLYGVFGRRAASIEGYRYSVNMKQLGETGHI